MKKINNKAFTMLELLASIIILIIISGIAISSVAGYLKKSHNEYCKSTVDMVTLAGRDYYKDNRSQLPLEGTKEVYLRQLINEKYIETVTDYNKKTCDIDRSKVVVSKQFGNVYYYNTYLYCNKCTTENTTKEVTSPTITFTPNKGTYTNKDANIKINIKDQKNDITSYRYQILQKINNNFTPIKEVIKDNVQKDNVNFNVKLNKKGTYKIKVSAYNAISKKTEATSGEYILNYVLDCNKQVSITTNDFQENIWKKGELDIKINAKGSVDSYDVYLKKDNNDYNKIVTFATKEISKKYSETGKYTFYIEARDDQGQSCKTKEYTYLIDNKAPTCTTSNISDSWTNNNVSLTYYCSDQESGCKQNIIIQTFTENMNSLSSPVVVYDNVGNDVTCPQRTIKIDKIAPSCKVDLKGTLGDNDYYISNKVTGKLTYDKNDSLSDIKYYDIAKSREDIKKTNTKVQTSTTRNTSTKKRYYGYVADEAGNFGECESKKFRLDHTQPTCNLKTTGVNYDTNNGWYNSGNVDVILKGSAGVSGLQTCKIGSKEVDCDGGKVTHKNSGANINYNATVTNKAGNSTPCYITFNLDKDNPEITSSTITPVGGKLCNGSVANKQKIAKGETATLKIKYEVKIKDKTSGVGSIRYILAPVAYISSAPTSKTTTTTIKYGNNITQENTNYIYTGEGGGSKSVSKSYTFKATIGPFDTDMYYCFDYSTNVQTIDKAGNWGY